jgi:hypothetical protein
MYWQDFDLRAWQPLSYSPVDEYKHMPITMNHPGSGWDINNITYNAISISDWSIFRLVDDILSPVNPPRRRSIPALEAEDAGLVDAGGRGRLKGVDVTHVSKTVDAVDRRAAHSSKTWVGDGVRALNVPEVSLSDYSPTSIGNMKRIDQMVDWLQERGTRLDDKLAIRTRQRTVLGAPATNSVIDGVQAGFWEAYRWVQRVGVQLLDEGLLNGIENGVDSSINAFRATPAETIVD